MTGLPPFILPPPETVAARFVDAWHGRHGLAAPYRRRSSRSPSASSSGPGSRCVVGYALARSALFERLLSPYLVAAQATPILALAPLLALWFGSGLLSKVVICALIVFFPVAIATMVGIRSVDARLLELGRSLRATRRQVLTTLEIPAALPNILGGMRVGVTLAVVGAIVGEWAGADHGLGVLINLARGSLFDTPLMFATLLTIALRRDRAVPRRRCRRAPARRRPMNQPRHPEVLVSPSRSQVRARSVSSSPCSSSPRAAAAAPSPARLPPRRRPPPMPRRRRRRRSAEPSVEPDKLVVGLGYIPSVQFAQFYLAQQKGYYAEAGLEVEFQNKIDPDLITLVGQGAIDVGIGDGTSVIPAVSNGIPVQYVATIYGQFPNVVFAKASSGITTRRRPRGRKIGTPGRYGSGWIMLQALLGSAGLTPDDVEIVEYPDFTQRAAVEQGAVDAATGFANNEPVQLELAGEPAVVLRIDDITPLPGPGLIAGTRTLESKHDAIAAFVAATLRAMDEIKADPTVGLDAAIVAVPELANARDAQLAVLDATIETWSRAGPGGRWSRRDRPGRAGPPRSSS